MYSQQKLVLRLLVAVLTLAWTVGTPAFGQSKDKDKDKTTQEQPASKIDLNTASEKDLDSLPGVGSATAKKIISNRPYASVDELKKAGLSQSKIDKLRPMVTVSAAAGSASGTTSEQKENTPDKSKSKTSTQQASNLPQGDNPSAAPPPGSGMVWVNLDSKVYHYEGDRWYGKTKHGKYMTEADAQKAGYRAAKDSKKKQE